MLRDLRQIDLDPAEPFIQVRLYLRHHFLRRARRLKRTNSAILLLLFGFNDSNPRLIVRHAGTD